MPNDPLTAARYPASSASPNVPQDIQNAVNDLSSTAIPRFANTTARDTAYTNWVNAGHTMVSGLHCTVAGATQVYRGGWKPLGDTLYRRVVNTASGGLAAGATANLQTAQTIPASPFGTSVPFEVDIDAQVRLSVPSGLGAKLELIYDGAAVLGGDEYTNGGSTVQTVTLKARDFATIADNSTHTITAVLTALAGTITVTTTYGRLLLTSRPYTAL